MRRTLALSLLLTALTVPALGQDSVTPGTPDGWLFGGNYEKYEVGTEVLPRMKPGTQTAYIKAGAGAECGAYGALFQTIAADRYRGKLLEFSARVFRQGVRLGNFSMFMFTRGPGDDTWVSRPGGVNSADRGNFRKEGIQLHVPADAQEITFGFRLSGPNGTGWADAVRLEVIEGYQPPRPSSVPAALKAPSVGTPESNRIAVQRFHGYYCGMRQSWLTARGVYELNERSLTTMAMLPAPQGVQVALAAE